MSKAPAKPAAGEAEAAPVKSKKMLFIIIGAVLILVAAGGAAAYFMSQNSGDHPKEKKHEPAKPPVFVPLDNFTVNLSADEGDKYLQVAMTMQVADEAEGEEIKVHMPQVRSRILLLLATQNASELLTEAGKNKLISNIVTEVNKPFDPKGEPNKISGVFFTSFVIQ
ncbi:MAG: flagellar basal body-associated protein FliL [Sulfuriferula sp.]